MAKTHSFLAEIRRFIFLAFLFAVFGDTLFVTSASDWRLLFIILLWLLTIKAYNFKSTATFKVALCYLAVLFLLFFVARTHPLTERISTWIFLFLGVGIIQQFFEIRAQ